MPAKKAGGRYKFNGDSNFNGAGGTPALQSQKPLIVWLIDVGFLFYFWGFQALAYFGFFAEFYFDGLGFGD